ncbi:MAG: GNAT family N-acetyltransferase [Chloroflexota bacterium]
MHPPLVIKAPPLDADRSIAALTTAFISDPLLRWMFPEPEEYLAHFGPLVRFFGGRAFEHDSAYRTDDFGAAAFWLPPGVKPDEDAMGELLQSVIPEDRHEEIFGLLEQVGNSHPDVEHWHLPVIGVDPRHQGAGYGTALLKHSLEVCDLSHQAAYLESSSPRNVSLYRRFGFEIIGEIQSGSSPVILPMLRPAR